MAVAVAAGAPTPQGSFPAGVAGEVGDVVALDDTGWRGASSEVSSSNSRFLICSMPCGTHTHTHREKMVGMLQIGGTMLLDFHSLKK